RGDGRAHARHGRRRARDGPGRPDPGGRGSPPGRGDGAPARMSVLIAILGLAFLVLIHEAGHFFVSLAVGMRPRRFYIGFPPAIAKVKRNGIEYGIGAIPLGGYVRIPGMHRPAAKDVDLVFSKALHAAPEL